MAEVSNSLANLIMPKPSLKNPANSNNMKWKSLKDLGNQDAEVNEDDRKSKLMF